MASKRAALSASGLSDGARGFILGNRAALMTQQRYLPAQKDFLVWLEDGTFESGINPTIPIAITRDRGDLGGNWLAFIVQSMNYLYRKVYGGGYGAGLRNRR